MASFRYKELPSQHIRLANLGPDGSITLSTHHLEKLPLFCTLSYVWGEPLAHSSPRVLCRSQDEGAEGLLAVTNNLYRALSYLHRLAELPIWIDAVCINQQSGREKEILVPKMGQIYGKARQVLVWLGPEALNSDLAMDVLSLLSGTENDSQRTLSATGLTELQVSATASVLSLGRSIDITNEEFGRLGLPAPAHPMWEALRHVYFREWFSRVWTFQEVKLATEAIVLCGFKSIKWSAFLHIGSRLARSQLLYGHLSDMSVELDAFDYPMDDTSLLHHLRTLRSRNCSRKEDRVYALLGLVSEEVRRAIAVKYDDNPNHYCSVYRSTGLLLLRLCGLDPVLSMASSAGKPLEIPSWCPDWSLPTISKGLFSWARAGHPRKSKASVCVHPLDPSRILVSGVCIDKIAAVNDSYMWHWPQGVSGEGGPAHRLLNWLDSCLDMTRRCGFDQRSELTCWETLCGDVPGLNPTTWIQYPPSLEVGFRALRKRLDENRRSVPISDTKMAAEERVALVPLIAYLGHMWRGRVFFTTQQGRVGFADCGIMKDDLACIFFGQPQIYILRQSNTIDGQKEPRTLFMSRSYIHGVMLGEACASTSEELDTLFDIS